MKLEPCPCGENPKFGFMGDEDGGYGYVECHKNGLSVVVHAETEAEAIAAWNARRTPPASQSDEALVIPGQIPPFLSAPTFDDRAEQRVCINGCLYLRADFAGERHASAHAAGRREGIEEAAKVADAGTGLAHVSEAHAMASARARSIAQNIRALAEKQP